MALASSTFLARPTQNRRAPKAKSSQVLTRWSSAAATVLYFTMGPAMSWGNIVTKAPKVTMFRWAGASFR